MATLHHGHPLPLPPLHWLSLKPSNIVAPPKSEPLGLQHKFALHSAKWRRFLASERLSRANSNGNLGQGWGAGSIFTSWR